MLMVGGMQAALITLCLLLITSISGSLWAVSNHVVTDPRAVCKKMRRLRGKMLAICKAEPLMDEIEKGVEIGTKECQYQFRNRRWNCTTMKKSLIKVISRDTRETSFVNAITAAGVTFSVTRACSLGSLMGCRCDMHSKRDHNRTSNKSGMTPGGESNWEWGGCGENINYGYRKSKVFMDYPYKKGSDMKMLIRLHNNDAGRVAIRNFMHPACKCHGLSGSCTTRICWRKMPPFREVGNRLKERFDGASKVSQGNQGLHFMPKDSNKQPEREDLVYSENSPDFCMHDKKTGSLGTVGRICNTTSPGVDGCELLCCGRGFDKRIVKEKFNCKCLFRWCCEVQCSTCFVNRTIYSCR